MHTPAAPLSHLRVAEIGDGLPIAYCGRQFALWGAEVVRMSERSFGRFTDAYVNANKFAAPYDTRLVDSADVVLTDRTDLDTETLAKDRVVLRFSNFGTAGPYASWQATDLVLQAISGYMAGNGKPGRSPLRAPGNIIDYACGVSAFVGVLAALRAGGGRLVDVSALEAIASLVIYTRPQYLEQTFSRKGGVGPPMLECEDGTLFCDYSLERQRTALFSILGVQDNDVPTDRDELPAFFASYTKRWRVQELFHAVSYLGGLAAIVNDTRSLHDDEHLRARAFFRPGGFAGPPAIASRAPAVDPARMRPFAGAVQRANEDRRSATGAPLAGVRVLDFTQAWLGPYATMLLADLGASVVKVESASRPDIWRVVAPLPPSARPGTHRWNASLNFNAVNRNKRDLTLDLDAPDARRIALRLVRDAHLVMENYTPNVMDKFGLGYEQLSAENPRLVMVSFSGFGKSGPYRDFKANGASVEPMAAWVSLFGHPDDEPITMGDYQADPLVGLHMAASALVGLIHADRTGQGQIIEGSMFEAAVGYIGESVLEARATGTAVTRIENRRRDMAPHGVFRCRGEDSWIAIAVRTDQEWDGLCRVLALDGSGFATTDVRLDDVDGVEELVVHATEGRDARDLCDRLQSAGVPAGVVQRTDEALQDPHLAPWFIPMTHPDLGTHRYTGFPWRFSGAALTATIPPPRLGEHSREVLSGELGLDDDEIADLYARKVTAEVFEYVRRDRDE